jgi:hypothetical protein
MKNYFTKAWRLGRWPLFILLAGYALLVAWDVVRISNSQMTFNEVVAIHMQHITLTDVEGKNLPPVPDQAENDATVAGIDKNNNGIRDDVELAIFKKYPDSAKIRAAELQYAMTEQMFLTEVSNTDTWKAVAEEDGRASSCLALTYPRDNLRQFMNVIDSRTKEVEDLVFNTKLRKDAEEQSFSHTTSFGDAPGVSCDVDLTTLPN